MNRVKDLIEKNQVMLVALCLTAILRLPSLIEPYWYGDEAIYLTIGQAIRGGVKLYSQIHDNKPPLLYLVAAIANGEQFWFKTLAMAWTMLTVTIFWKLVSVLLGKGIPAKIALFIFIILTNTPLWEGNIANAELFFLLPTITAAYVLWGKKIGSLEAFVGGFLYGVAALFKMPAVLEAGVWPIMWLIFWEKSWGKKTLLLLAGILTPIALSVFYFYLNGSGSEYFVAAWKQNIPYLSSWNTSGQTGIFSLTGRATIAAMLLVPIVGFSKRWGRKITGLCLWFLAAVFAALLSGRPYPHYLLQTAGIAGIFAGMLFERNKTARISASGVVIILLMVFYGYKFYTYPIVGYYQNFISFVTNKVSLEQYIAHFDQKALSNYRVATLIKSRTKPMDKIFIWGDEPMIYALARKLPVGKYTVKYHIKDFRAEEETLKRLSNSPPRYVVITNGDEDLPGLGLFISANYFLEDNINNTLVYRLAQIADD
jgi:hypothetical protein